MPATVADLLGLLDLTAAGTDRFVGRQPATSLQRVFGGQVAAQALTAATATVPEREAGSTPIVHSLHGYFLRPGQTSKPITYDVERLRDGRAFATRRVQASQDEVPIFASIVSFHAPEPGFEHADAMPDVAPAADCPTLGDILAGVSGRDPTAFLAEWDALEVRYAGDNRPGGGLAPDAHPARARLWIRTAGALPADPAVHASVLTYASDLTLLGAALVPHGTYIGAPGLLVASIDHAMWFHRPVRADEWMLYDQISPSAGTGLGFVTGRLFAADGALIASVAQEGLLRQTGSSSNT
jgi:acyl-CoA thioesterase-2